MLIFSDSEPTQVYSASQNLQDAFKGQLSPYCHLADRMLTKPDSDASADIPTQGVASSELKFTSHKKINADSRVSAPDNSYNADEDFCNLAVPNNRKCHLSLTDLNKYRQPQIPAQLVCIIRLNLFNLPTTLLTFPVIHLHQLLNILLMVNPACVTAPRLNVTDYHSF